jgi:hypothetical protein
VQEAADLALLIEGGGTLFQPPDEHHLVVHPEQFGFVQVLDQLRHPSPPLG